jgi:Flp pilus assembly protein TadG
MRHIWRNARRLNEERGATLVIMTFALVALVGLTGLAVDVGRLFAARAELTRVADAAALAGIQSFPDVSAAITKAQNYGKANDSSATITASQVGTTKQLKVTATKSVPMTFMKVLGFGNQTVKASATAGFGGILDLVIVMDETASMDGQPLTDAQSAAKTLVGQLLPDPSGNTAVGLAPFRTCYVGVGSCPSISNPDTWEKWFASVSRVPTSHVQALTTNQTTITNTINSLTADGATNVCSGILKGQSVLFGSGSHTDPKTQHVMVILSDGDNNPHGSPYITVPSPCTSANNTDFGASCSSTESPEGTLDRNTYNLAQTLKGQGVEIYVVGYGVCGSASSTTCTSAEVAKIGTVSELDDTADRRLLKCIASSTSGTNDHYIEAATSAQLQGIFQAIGAAITTRLTQ